MTRRVAQIFAWTALAAVILVTVLPLDMRPRDVLSVDADRAIACSVFAALFMLAYPRHWALISILMIGGAAASEALQLLSPTRHARIDDAIVKASGAVIGVAVAGALNVAIEGFAAWSASSRRARAVAAATDAMSLQSLVQDMPVQSRLIESISFSPEDGKLRIHFRNGKERAFENVPKEEAINLVASESPGEYYVENIRTKFRRSAA